MVSVSKLLYSGELKYDNSELLLGQGQVIKVT